MKYDTVDIFRSLLPGRHTIRVYSYSQKQKMVKSLEARLWTIKISSKKAYLYKGGKKVEHLKNIVAARSVSEARTSTSKSSPRSKCTKSYIELEFVPNHNISYQFAKLNPEYFNKFGCDGELCDIDSKEAEQLAIEIMEKLRNLNETDSAASETTDTGSEVRSQRQQQKHPLTPLYSTKTKKQKIDPSQHVKNLEERCNECQLDNKTYFIPIEKLIIPPKNRQIRAVDDSFLTRLIEKMKNQPAGSYEALFVVVKGIDDKNSFIKDKIDEYEYEVLGGTHITLATKELHQKFPDNPNYSGRVARIYVGLEDKEALWLGAMHNNTGGFRHTLTYKDEVDICRTQLFVFGDGSKGDEPPKPTEAWRDMCSKLINKSKRNLSEVFSLAQIPDEGWNQFNVVINKWEKGQLKDQKMKASDIVKKGKPILKQWQLKPLCSLEMADRIFLLEKVAKQEMSLEEMKEAASDIKLLRPIQEAIINFFKLSNWENAETMFGKEVAVNRLLRFAGNNFEQCHEFQKFLEKLKRKKEGVVCDSGDLMCGQGDAKGFTVSIGSLTDVEQSMMTKLPNFEGAFLAIGDTREDCKISQEIISVVTRINFTLLTSFNVVLFVNIDEIKEVKSKMREGGAFLTQTGHFYLRDKFVTEKKDSLLKPSLLTFVIGHWSVSKVLSERHLTGGCENVITVERKRNEEIPESCYIWLVSNLSRDGDTIVDVNSESGDGMVYSLNESRNAVWITTTSSHLHESLKEELYTKIRAANDSVDSAEEAEEISEEDGSN